MSLKFLPGRKVMEDGGTMQFSNFKQAQESPLAKRIFAVEGITAVFFAEDFISVTADNDNWLELKPHVFAAITDFFASGLTLIRVSGDKKEDSNLINDEDDEVVAMIKELIETRIRPNVQEDGGDIRYVKFEEGVVYVELQGSCAGCPSSSVTLKHGIENMLMHYIPEVDAVESWEPDGDGEHSAAPEPEAPEDLREKLSTIQKNWKK